MKRDVLHHIFIILFFTCACIGKGQSNIELVDFGSSECLSEPSTYLLQKRIVSQELRSDTLFLEIATWVNCALSDYGIAKLTSDVLRLESLRYPPEPEITATGDTIPGIEEVVPCDCCFHFNYVVKGIKEIPATIIHNGDSLELLPNKYLPPTYKVYHGDTLVATDSEGYSYSYRFYDSNKIRQLIKRNSGHNVRIRYYENGQVENRFEYFGDFDIHIESKYDEEGNLISYRNTTDEIRGPDFILSGFKHKGIDVRAFHGNHPSLLGEMDYLLDKTPNSTYQDTASWEIESIVFYQKSKQSKVVEPKQEKTNSNSELETLDYNIYHLYQGSYCVWINIPLEENELVSEIIVHNIDRPGYSFGGVYYLNLTMDDAQTVFEFALQLTD